MGERRLCLRSPSKNRCGDSSCLGGGCGGGVYVLEANDRGLESVLTGAGALCLRSIDFFNTALGTLVSCSCSEGRGTMDINESVDSGMRGDEGTPRACFAGLAGVSGANTLDLLDGAATECWLMSGKDGWMKTVLVGSLMGELGCDLAVSAHDLGR